MFHIFLGKKSTFFGRSSTFGLSAAAPEQRGANRAPVCGAAGELPRRLDELLVRKPWLAVRL
jgi:hypothetical protein